MIKLANIITGSRIVCSLFLLLLPVRSTPFYIVYLLGGFSDMIDGTIARKTGSSKLGAWLDSAADIIFFTAAFFKWLPVIVLPGWVWAWTILVAIVKISHAVWGFVRWTRIISMHTLLNKATGLMLFLLPLTLNFIEIQVSAAVVCVLATVSAIQEGYYIGKNREVA